MIDKLITKLMNQYWQNELNEADIILQNHFSHDDIKVALEIALANSLELLCSFGDIELTKLALHPIKKRV